MDWEIIKNSESFSNFLSSIDLAKPIAIDTETYKQRFSQPSARLLGVAISAYSKAGKPQSCYIVTGVNPILERNLGLFLQNPGYGIVGWNVPFDKMWLDWYLEIDTQWRADGRIMWHLSNNDPTVRGFGLKKAQKILLGWEESNDKELEENVASKGGTLSDGDHYLADLPILAKYACLDTYSTLLCYEKMAPFFNNNQYWEFQKEVLNYSILLSQAAAQGLPVDSIELLNAAALYTEKREIAKKKIEEVCAHEIQACESAWKEKQAYKYKTEKGRERYLHNPSAHRRFNPSSSHQRALLLHTMLEFPVTETTPTGLPRTDRTNIRLIKHPSAEALLAYSEAKKVAEQAKTYLKAVENGRMYTNYDVCGTVSGRLSGFSPSILNMPFEENEVMHSFKCDEGFIGIHADLASIEPCVLCFYSEDPTLLKVYREGLGDIYLDLAVDLFPDNLELKKDYDPHVPIISEVKNKFKDVRGICKTIHLAVSYTGTHVTVAKNLTKNGFPTTQSQAMVLVKNYWKKFRKVKLFEKALHQLCAEKGFVRNLTGRIVRVPPEFKKDLMNRLVQSSAHDILRLWCMRIVEEFNEKGVVWRYWLPDLHDSTTFMIKEGSEELARQCYLSSLKWVEEKIGITVPLKAELKFCKTLAGVKGDE